MGWLGTQLGRLVAGVAGAPPLELIFVPSLPAAGIPGMDIAIEPDACYIELYLESMRLNRARKFATNFHPVFYSFVSLIREGEPRALLTAVSRPEGLMSISPDSIDKAIPLSKQLMGRTAFRGNPVSLELGLFSVKSGNLLSPIVNYVTRVSEVAGISCVGAIKPFVPLIIDGMDLIAGQSNDTSLEVGVDTDMNIRTSGVAAIIAKPKGTLDVTKLSLDQDHKLLFDGKPLESGYAVFSIRHSLQKNDFGEIPDLKERYAALQAAIRSNDKKNVQDALTAFRLATLASPDLIPSDARNLVDKAKKKVKDAMGGQASPESFELETLAEIGLYDTTPKYQLRRQAGRRSR